VFPALAAFGSTLVGIFGKTPTMKSNG
jgi:hypothetical protein